jgi:2-polyprenyl-6-methoxyphenol hydroxylase-like FAD-dependent oxidoreductase
MPGPLAIIFIYDYSKSNNGYFTPKYSRNFADENTSNFFTQNAMLLHDKQVAIIGGGPGGLTLARLLQQQGVAVRVYERDATPQVRPQGSTLDLHHDTGLKALAAAGLLEDFKQHYRPGADRTRLLNRQLEVLLDDHAAPINREFGDAHFRPEIDRGPLRDLLVASLAEGVMVWDARFVEMQPAGAGWEIHFENGTRAYADVVVAADGANSKVRKYVTDIPPVYAGTTFLEGHILEAAQQAPALWQLVRGGSLFALENGQFISFLAKGDGSLLFWLWLKKPESWLTTAGIDWTSRAAVAAWFAQEFSTWSPQWQQLFAPDTLTIVPRQTYYYPTDKPWPPRPNLTLLGDAAHRMPPNGEGVNQAMADALDLAEALCNGYFGTIAQAIAAFEQTMGKRVALVAAETQQLLEMMHADNNQQLFLDFFTGAPAPVG